MMKRLLILGAGGFGQMIKETAELLGYEEVFFLDDAAKASDVIGKCCDYVMKHGEFDTAVAAFGNIGIVFRRQAPRCHWSPRLLTHVQMPCHQSQVLF